MRTDFASVPTTTTYMHTRQPTEGLRHLFHTNSNCGTFWMSILAVLVHFIFLKHSTRNNCLNVIVSRYKFTLHSLL